MAEQRTLPPLPMMPEEGASFEEICLAFAGLIDWVVKARLADLLAAGLTHADVFRLVKVADDCQFGRMTPDTLATLDELAPKLHCVRVF